LEAKGYIVIILAIVWVGIIVFASSYIFPSQPENKTLSMNSSNNTTVNTTSLVQNQTKKQILTENQAVSEFKKYKGESYSNNTRYVATLYHVQGKPYYSITIINKNNGTSEDSPAAVNAVTGKLESPE
jgi:hypothetical protein